MKTQRSETGKQHDATAVTGTEATPVIYVGTALEDSSDTVPVKQRGKPVGEHTHVTPVIYTGTASVAGTVAAKAEHMGSEPAANTEVSSNQQEAAGAVMEKIARVQQARRKKFYVRETQITLSHGSGGKATHNLIEGVFGPAFANPMLDQMDDAATFAVSQAEARLAFTTILMW